MHDFLCGDKKEQYHYISLEKIFLNIDIPTLNTIVRRITSTNVKKLKKMEFDQKFNNDNSLSFV